MIKLVRTHSDNVDFRDLVRRLDEEMAIRNGAHHAFYSQFNKLDRIRHVVVAYLDGLAVSCGGIREFSSDTQEVKRMYTRPEGRGKGLGARVLSELEDWTRELGFKFCILETGKLQPEAIRLYEKSGYSVIPSFGQYAGYDNSVCFRKELKV